jgi:hypothetical protein
MKCATCHRVWVPLAREPPWLQCPTCRHGQAALWPPLPKPLPPPPPRTKPE